jgi:hypothetical protein
MDACIAAGRDCLETRRGVRIEMAGHRLTEMANQHSQGVVEGQGDCRQERRHDASSNASGSQQGTEVLAQGISLPSRVGLGLRV